MTTHAVAGILVPGMTTHAAAGILVPGMTTHAVAGILVPGMTTHVAAGILVPGMTTHAVARILVPGMTTRHDYSRSSRHPKSCLMSGITNYNRYQCYHYYYYNYNNTQCTVGLRKLFIRVSQVAKPEGAKPHTNRYAACETSLFQG